MRAPAKSFQDLIVWQKSHEFVLGVYKLTQGFPKLETYGLVSQFRRSAISVPANIAEGFRRSGKRDKTRFLNIAEASMEECRYYLILARDLRYCDPSELLTRAKEISKLLSAYTRAILTPDS
ncbi:MAG TPA: four helix bundle protein [Phycisphaerae bacterium]|nr:four helix bundle protein [Phycisphaerae bacterium]